MTGFSVQKSGETEDNTSFRLVLHDPDLTGLVRLAVSPNEPLVRKDANVISLFTPVIIELDQAERERIEQRRERESRRKRRQTRGRPIPAAIPNSTTPAPIANTPFTAIPTTSSWNLRSPPRSMPTDPSYRGSINRRLTKEDEEEGSASLINTDGIQMMTDKKSPRVGRKGGHGVGSKRGRKKKI